MMNLKTKKLSCIEKQQTPVEIFYEKPKEELANHTPGELWGYASTNNIIDEHKDHVMPGAFKETIEFWQNNNKTENFFCPVLWDHKTDEPPIGKVVRMQEDANGLYVHIKLFMDMPRAQEIYNAIKRNSVRSLSIGYLVKAAHKIGRIRKITQIEIKEISVVTFPANNNAIINDIKCSYDHSGTKELLNSINAIIKIINPTK